MNQEDMDKEESSVNDRRSVLRRATLILEAFDDEHAVLKLRGLSARTGLPRSTVHRTAEQLVELRWLERGPDGYRPGLLLFELGGLVPRVSWLRRSALPFMEDLYEGTHELVQLAVLDGNEVVYVDKIGGHASPMVISRPGGRLPASCTGLGKAMLAHSSEVTIAHTLERGLDSRTPNSIVDLDEFRRELATIRRCGVAIDHEEAQPGIACVAAPIRGSGRAIAAISLTGPIERMDVERLAPAVTAAAAGVWRALFPTRSLAGRAPLRTTGR